MLAKAQLLASSTPPVSFKAVMLSQKAVADLASQVLQIWINSSKKAKRRKS
ncbi:MAG: hypothetical protein IPO37_01150 [Saprospiraceae bacterium]|nr:hypothetical protein [Saprospiraceae bacterium]